MGPNDAEVIRVFTREPGAPVADVTLASNANAEVVIEAEAGNAVFTAGAQFTTGLVIQDLESGTAIPFTPAAVGGALSKPEWPNQAQAFVYTIQQADLALHAGHLCQAYAYLLIGTSNFGASFVESPLFLILP